MVSVVQGRLRPYTYAGVPYAKVGNTKTKMSQDERDRLTAERLHQSDSWDSSRASIGLEDLDLDELAATISDAVTRQRMSELGDMRPMTMLRAFGLVTREGAVRNAAAVLFGAQPALLAEYPQCTISLVRYDGTTKTSKTIDNRRYEGNVFTLLRQAEGFLADHLRVVSEIVGLQRNDVPEIPVFSQREAIVNALCHRQYETPGATSIYIYDDRVEVGSIGPLHFGLRAADLRVPHESQPWNPLVANVMYRRGYVDSQGSGTLRMLERARAEGKWPPEIIDAVHSVRVQFTRDGHAPTRFAKRNLSEARLSILRVISASYEPVAPADIVTELKTHRVTVSEHLSYLTSEGLVRRVGQGRATRYALGL